MPPRSANRAFNLLIYRKVFGVRPGVMDPSVYGMCTPRRALSLQAGRRNSVPEKKILRMRTPAVRPPRSFWNEVPPGGHATRRSPMMADATVSASHENRDSQSGDDQNRAAYERDEDRVLPASSASNAGGYRI